MQSSFFPVYCANGHPVHKLCIKRTCQHPSAICSTEDCTFSKIHKSCHQYTQVTSIFNVLMEYAKQQSSGANQLVIGLINRLIKELQVMKGQYLGVFDGRLEGVLGGKKRELWGYLKRGPAEKVTSKLVIGVLDGDEEEEKQGQEKNLANLKEIVNRVQQQFQQSLKELKKWLCIEKQQIVPLKDKPQFRFLPQLTNLDRVSISNQGRTLKSITTSSSRTFSLISPALCQPHPSKLLLKMIKNNKSVCLSIGVARKSKLLLEQFSWPKRNDEIHVINSNGYSISFQNPNGDGFYGKNSNFFFGPGSVLQLQYFEEREVLKITNLKVKNSCFEMENVGNKEKDLYFCVENYGDEDQWEILDSI